jgi:hypothetical protein
MEAMLESLRDLSIVGDIRGDGARRISCGPAEELVIEI